MEERDIIAEEHIIEALDRYRERFGIGALSTLIDDYLTRLSDREVDKTVRPLTYFVEQPRAIRRCAVEGCDGRVYAAHRLCTVHRLRLERTGDPMLVRKRGRKKKVVWPG